MMMMMMMMMMILVALTHDGWKCGTMWALCSRACVVAGGYLISRVKEVKKYCECCLIS